MKSGIAIAYSGVHQAYQIALAATELGELDRFYCSLIAAPGKWGGWLETMVGAGALANRRLSRIPPDKVSENPWPLFAHRGRAWLSPQTANDWGFANQRFDRWVARRLAKSDAAIFVGVETCASQSFKAAAQRGMIRVLDCPGIDAEFLDALARCAADEFGLKTSPRADSAAIRAKKQRELELADAVIACSELQANLIAHRSAPRQVVHLAALWVDGDFWRPTSDRLAEHGGPLRVVYAGKINLRKGVPYLVRAVLSSEAPVALTMIGALDDELKDFLAPYHDRIRLLPPCSKSMLRGHYAAADLLVLPSLGDAFGFVAMEAMACGLPVIVTENCGVPVPDPSWRVPVMNADAIAERLTLYADNRELCREHGRIATGFAGEFTPDRYRHQVKNVFQQWLFPAHATEPQSARTSEKSLGHRLEQASIE